MPSTTRTHVMAKRLVRKFMARVLTNFCEAFETHLATFPAEERPALRRAYEEVLDKLRAGKPA